MKDHIKRQDAYKNAGVDIEAGAELVERIKPAVRQTVRPGVVGGLGGFGAVFDLKQTGYQDPLLVSATDGVGTKLRIAIDTGLLDTVGIDLVAMCANDLVTTGAEPLYFLDYFACGALDVERATRVINGIAEGCRLAGCALTGGETAEMPGMYASDDFDLAGFCVGAVERDRVIDGAAVAEGDVVLGLASSGLHSNGYSLVRRIIGQSGLGWDMPAPYAPDVTLGADLMTPTRLYIKSLLPHLPMIRAMANITGGGLPENAHRMVPDHLALRIDARAWDLPPVFGWLAEQGGLTADELARTLNCGIGMIVICAATDEAALTAALTQAGERVMRIGAVEPSIDGQPRVRIDNTDHWPCRA